MITVLWVGAWTLHRIAAVVARLAREIESDSQQGCEHFCRPHIAIENIASVQD